MTTTDIVIQQRRINPCATLETIGQTAGVTRERARQILKENELPTRHWIQSYICLNCGRVLPHTGGTQRKPLYCNHRCQHEYTFIKIACEECGKLVERSAKRLIWDKKHRNYNHRFCSYQCKGKWIGRTYGFKTGVRNKGDKGL